MNRLATLVVLFVPLILAAQNKIDADKGPGLGPTMDFMSQMLEPDGFSLNNDGCSVTLTRSVVHAEIFIPKGTTVGKDASGVPEIQFTWSIIEVGGNVHTVRFNLADIDPESTKVFRVLSAKHFQELGQRGTIRPPIDFDRSVLLLITRDLKKAIHDTSLVEMKGQPGVFKDSDEVIDQTSEFILLTSKDGAERLLTALRHAIQLCGGRPSDFPPAKN